MTKAVKARKHTGNSAVPNRSSGEIAALVRDAAERIRPWVFETPFEAAPGLLPGKSGVLARWKLECFQVTGSFKARGAMNRLLRLREEHGPDVLRKGVVTASSGNHGRAVAHGLDALGGRGIVFLPTSVADGKRRALESRYGDIVELRFAGADAIEAERAARRESERAGLPYVSPYNDIEVIAGQGTVGLEMSAALGSEPLDAVLVPVGGGGLVAGVAGYLKAERPGIRVIGCQPAASAVMAASMTAGRILESGRETPFEPTLADGVAGGVEVGAMTFDACRDRVDEWVLLEESEIAEAMRLVLRERFAVVEGSGALPVAALGRLASEGRAAGLGSVGLVISGAGISGAGLSELARPLDS